MIKKKLGVTKPTFKFDLQRFDGETVFPETLDKDTDGAYLIKTAEDLQTLATYVNAGNTCEGLTFKLTAASKVIEVPENCDLSTFAGTIDGSGNILRGVNNSIGGTVKNLTYTGTAIISGETNAKYHFISLPDGATVAGASSDTPSGVYRTDDGQNIFLQDGGTFQISGFSAGKEITFDSIVTLSATDDATIFTAKVGNDTAFTLQLNVTLNENVTAAHWNGFTFVEDSTPETLSADKNKITYNAVKDGENLFSVTGFASGTEMPAPTLSDGVYTITLPTAETVTITEEKTDVLKNSTINAGSISNLTVPFAATVTTSGSATVNGVTYTSTGEGLTISTTATGSQLVAGTVTVTDSLTTSDDKTLTYTGGEGVTVTVEGGVVTSITDLSAGQFCKLQRHKLHLRAGQSSFGCNNRRRRQYFRQMLFKLL